MSECCYSNNLSSSCPFSIFVFFFREPTWQIFAQSCCFVEISLKSQQAISRSVSSSCLTTFWFTARESPGEKGNFYWLTAGKKLDMEKLEQMFTFLCRQVFSMQAKQKQQHVSALPIAVFVWMYMCYRHRFFSYCGTGISGCFPCPE